MQHNLLMDNWTLQHVGELLCTGLIEDDASDLVLTKNGKSYRYETASADAVRFQALCQFLNNLVFADSLFVDEMFAHTWKAFTPLAEAHSAQVIITKPFQDCQDEWSKTREAMADELCVNPALLKQHNKNKRMYAATGKADDELLSQLIWGGAGMLARADYFRLPYVPHPARERLFRSTVFMQGPSAASVQIDNFITSERLKIHKRIDGSGYLTSLHLPPIAVQIIDAATETTDIIKTARQVRTNYTALRKWLARLQQALDCDDTKAILAHGKELESVARHIDSHACLTPIGDTTVQFGLGWLKINLKGGSPVNTIKNKFGMRAELNRLILGPAGHHSLNKFLRMLGEQHTRRGQALKAALVQRFAKPK
jgi:hypothetical protein